MAVEQNRVNVLLLGDQGVGKSCLLLRAAENSFTHHFIATIGVSHKPYSYDNTRVNIFDYEHHSRCSVSNSLYQAQPKVVLLCFDLTNKQSFKNLSNWVDDADRYRENISYVLVGTKSEMEVKREVFAADVEDFIETMNTENNNKIVFYQEVSAQKGTNCRSLFERIGNVISSSNDNIEETFKLSNFDIDYNIALQQDLLTCFRSTIKDESIKKTHLTMFAHVKNVFDVTEEKKFTNALKSVSIRATGETYLQSVKQKIEDLQKITSQTRLFTKQLDNCLSLIEKNLNPDSINDEPGAVTKKAMQHRSN